MSFGRKHVPLIHPYSLNGFPRVFEVENQGFYLTPTLSFENHTNTTIGRAVKVLGFISATLDYLRPSLAFVPSTSLYYAPF